MQFTVTLKLRPIRIAFFIRPNDSEPLLRAIAINSFLWGGHLNPLIPLYKKRPSQWVEEHDSGSSISPILKGYLDAFDPDFVTAIGVEQRDLPDIGHRKFIEVTEIMEDVGRTGLPHYGIGYYEIVRHFGYEELRFERRDPIELAVPELAKDYQPFLASIVGQLPSEVEDDARAKIRQAYNTRDLTCDITTFCDFLRGPFITPRRLCSQTLKPEWSASAWDRNYIMYLDARSTIDVVDYWNLRSLGFTVMPFPKQCSGDQRLVDEVGAFVAYNAATRSGKSNLTHHATVLRGRSIPENEFRAFVKESQAFRMPHESTIRVATQSWFPPFWDEWSRRHNFCERISVYSERRESDVSADEEHLRFTPLVPSFMDRRTYGARIANDVYLSTYSSDEPVAEVLPEGSKELAEAIDYHLYTTRWRFAENGLVLLPDLVDLAVSMRVPLSQPLVEQWFSTKGWTVSASSAGRAIQQLLRRVGGLYGTGRIADENIIRLLQELSSGKPMSSGELHRKAKAISQERMARNKARIISSLTHAQLIALGLTVACPTCGRHPWYSLKQIDYAVQCTKCHAEIQISAYSQDDVKWAYRATGPLSSLAVESGALGVLLVFRFFGVTLRCRMTPAFGVELTRDGASYEVDFLCLLRPLGPAPLRPRLLLAECKSYNGFQADDTRKLKALGATEPGSVLVFSTLRKDLTAGEKRLIIPIANRGRQPLTADRTRNPVLVLTGNELFAGLSLAASWESLGGQHERLARYAESGIDELCDATQQLYLGLEPLAEARNRKIAQVRRRGPRRDQADPPKHAQESADGQ